MHDIRRIIIPAVLAGSVLVGCGTDQSNLLGVSVSKPTKHVQASAAEELPSYPGAEGFVANITNPYLGWRRGRVFTYESETDDGLETIVVEVTRRTKTILGVATTVIHDQVFLDGELIEDTFDWYAQDKDGNVWYFGEDSKEIVDGEVVSTEGSWEAGVDGAQPGIIMLANPTVGTTYQQEVAPGVAEDMAKVVSLTGTADVPYGNFTGTLVTKEWTPLASGAPEYKYYAPGVGLVLETGSGGSSVELVSIKH